MYYISPRYAAERKAEVVSVVIGWVNAVTIEERAVSIYRRSDRRRPVVIIKAAIVI